MSRTARHNRGFTLIEILVVLAISMILMGLVIGPVIQSFSLTRQAQAMVDAQDSARHAMEMISRELGEAMFVFDNSVTPIEIYDDGTTPAALLANGEGPIQLPVRQPTGTIRCFTLPYGKIDMILPKIAMHCNNPDHDESDPRDYDRGLEALPPCPYCNSANVEARPKLPLEQDETVVRYFLGLRYNNPNLTSPSPREGEGVFGWRSPWGGEVAPEEENQVVLYRVEFRPDDDTLFPANTSGMILAEYQSRNLQDPVFFYRTALNSKGVACCVEWAKRAQVIGIGKYQDLVAGTYVNMPADMTVTAVEPSVTFRFSGVDNDTLSAPDVNGTTFEYPDAAPTAYDANYGYWMGSSYQVTVYRDDNDIAYTTEVMSGNLMVVKRTYDGSAWTAPEPTFNITRYLANGTVSSGVTGTGSSGPVETAFTIDENRGRVNFSLAPPRPSGQMWATVFDTAAIQGINLAYHDTYREDRGSAIRSALLSTFDPPPPRNGYYLEHARVVPGSDKVTGPDMTPGNVPTRLVPYERVPLALGDPGLNQYKIDCDTGMIYFSSAYDQDIPETGEIDIDYRICFNMPDDVVKADYTTKSLVTVHLGMRMFDPDTGKLHTVDLDNSVKVGNSFR